MATTSTSSILALAAVALVASADAQQLVGNPATTSPINPSSAPTDRLLQAPFGVGVGLPLTSVFPQFPSKFAVESPIKVAAGLTAPIPWWQKTSTARVADVPKLVVEAPIKQFAFGPPRRPVDFPPDDPGTMRVRWHDGTDAAIEAAAASGRPVLVFQLLGSLDDAFC